MGPGRRSDGLVGPRARVRPRRLFRLAVRERLRRTRTPLLPLGAVLLVAVLPRQAPREDEPFDGWRNTQSEHASGDRRSGLRCFVPRHRRGGLRGLPALRSLGRGVAGVPRHERDRSAAFGGIMYSTYKF